VAPSDPDAIRIEGIVRDGAGEPLIDALVEVWQANRAGRYAHPEDTREELPLEEGFTGFGRCGTDADGRFAFVTVKPGRVPAPDGRPQAPHINVSVLARGLLKRLATRVYFPDEDDANGADPVLAAVDPARRSTLVAVADGEVLRFDVNLQGDAETVFFAV
jgi:protocatechuate 3,4-dioxygenase alpha subunit